MPDQMPPKREDGPKGSPPPPMHDVPPHIMHELMDLKEKVGRLEGMVEMMMHSKHQHCVCPECKKGK
ncbi:MAG TPA: hypothetical protein VMR19_01745 [Candidatus Saccharimonadales bacterium]|jgi:hypothetical protein|nr:hypothetical protein [Candidatus Saccharimonadales bacterium]